jgi:hypothetical protein
MYGLTDKMRVLGFPVFQFDANPEAVNAECDDGQCPPLDPVPEQSGC